MASKISLVTWIAGLLIISVSGTEITVCPSQINGTPCQIICETTDFSQTIIFLKDATSAGFCSSGGICGTAIAGYVTPYRLGINQTVLNISAYSGTRDSGEWTCNYGTSTSPAKIMHYAIPPTSATVTPNNYTVNTNTQIIVRTECAYINISGIIEFKGRTYSQNQTCTEVPSGGCASGTGEKYTCTFILNQGYMATGTYELEFRVDLPYDNTNPKVNLTTPVYVTFPESLTTTETTNEFHYTSTANSNQNIHKSITSNFIPSPGEITGIALGGLVVLSITTVIVYIIIQRKRSGRMANKKNNPI